MRILVIEDETMVARSLCRMIREILQDRILNLHHVHSLQEAEDYLLKHEIDLMFLDLNLSGEDGFDLLTNAVSSNFQTIIVSGNLDQALRSYDYGVLDFVAKPFTPARLSKALSKFRHAEENRQAGLGKARYLGVRSLGKTLLVPVDEVTHIKAAERYSELFLANGKTHLHEKRLKQLLLILPELFQRIHKSHLVNLEFAQEINSQPGSVYNLCLQDGTQLRVGRNYLPLLRKRLH